jgi:hypothetical protein
MRRSSLPNVIDKFKIGIKIFTLSYKGAIMVVAFLVIQACEMFNWLQSTVHRYLESDDASLFWQS